MKATASLALPEIISFPCKGEMSAIGELATSYTK